MASKYRKKFSLPEGFYPILENYCREVLRDQPLDIVEFSYLYFKACEEVSNYLNFRPFLLTFCLHLQGNIETFNYPKKGQNIPPDRNERPVSMGEEYDDEEGEGKEYDDENGQDEQYGDEEGQSYYDENGQKVEQDQEEYYPEADPNEENEDFWN